MGQYQAQDMDRIRLKTKHRAKPFLIEIYSFRESWDLQRSKLHDKGHEGTSFS